MIDTISPHFEPFRFQQRGHRLIRLSHDLLEVIEINPLGNASHEQIRIGLIPICWEGLVFAHPLVGSKKLATIVPEAQYSQKEHGIESQISFLTGPILSYFERYNSTEKILRHIDDFEPKKLLPATDFYQFRLLILFCELRQEKPSYTPDFLDQYIGTHLYKGRLDLKDLLNQQISHDNVTEWMKLKSLLKKSNWKDLHAFLDQKQGKVLSKLSLHSDNIS